MFVCPVGLRDTENGARVLAGNCKVEIHGSSLRCQSTEQEEEELTISGPRGAKIVVSGQCAGWQLVVLFISLVADHLVLDIFLLCDLCAVDGAKSSSVGEF